MGISTPTYEFFLLLHFDNLSEFTKEAILNNAKSGKRRLLESLLIAKCEKENFKFRKYNYDSNWFIDHFEVGLKNSLEYDNDLDKLKENPGTSLFELLKEMIEVSEVE